MIYFYIVIAVVFCIGFIFDLILWHTENIKSFGVEKEFHKFKGKIIPTEKLIPQNVTMLLIYFIVFGISGILLDLIKLVWFLSLPCAVFSGFLFCFFYQYPLQLAIKKFKKIEMPKGEEASGTEGYLVQPISESACGIIRFEWKGEVYEAPAFSANDTDLPEFERVIIILEQNGCYCVEGVTEVYNAL